MQTLKEVHPLPDLRKSCSLQNFIQVKIYVSWQLPKFNSIQFFLSHVQEELRKCTSKCTIKRLRQVPVQTII